MGEESAGETSVVKNMVNSEQFIVGQKCAGEKPVD